MVRMQHVTKHYGSFLALEDIGFEVGAGEVVAFLGPNGAGKTTTMRILTGFMPPDSGEVSIDGLDVFEEARAVRERLGYLPETPPLYPEMTVLEYLDFVAELKGVAVEHRKSAVDRAVEMTDLGERRSALIRQLSKGLRQRVGIAQAVVNFPKVLILDEPTVGLDPIQVAEVRSLIRKLSTEEGRTVILSTHILSEASEICQKAIIVSGGKIVAVDRIDSLRKGGVFGLQVVLKTVRVSQGLSDKLSAIPGVTSVEASDGEIHLTCETDIREEAARIAVESGAGLLELYQKQESLESVFMKLVQ